jgi:ABC-type dipeptide/oligopeptide/nickel transport system permease subunit
MMSRAVVRTRRALLRQPVVLASVGWLAMAGLAALLAPLLAPGGPLSAATERSLLPPGLSNPLGTDLFGRDILVRLVWGGRWTLGMAALALTITIGLGLPTGLVAGYMGGRVDSVMMRMVDAVLAFPGLLLAMAIVAILGTGIGSVAVAVGFATAPAYARVARSAALDVRSQPFVEAARALGSGPVRTLIRHILPNTAAPLIAFAATQLGWVLLNGAALSFLGLGAPPGAPEWGSMLKAGRGYLHDAPWVSGFPGLALMLTVLAANVLGNGLQRALQPQ